MKKILGTDWFVVLAGSLAYLGTTYFCFSTATFTVPRTEPESAPATYRVTESWAFLNPDLDHMIEDLKHEKQALTQREQQLRDLEARLASERQELKQATTAIERLQKDLNQTILRVRQEEIPNLKRMAKTHAAMSPDGSANILKEQSDDEVLKILFYMKPAESGPIIEALGALGKTEAQRAARLTERLRRGTEEPAKEAKS